MATKNNAAPDHLLALRLVESRRRHSGDHAMQVADGQVDESVEFAPRQRDRRRGLGDVIAAVARGVSGRVVAGLLRGAFEDSLKRVLSVRSIALREATSRWVTPRPEERPGIESVAFEVPAPTPAGRGVLEATFDPGCRMAEWDFQLLGQAAQLAGLVLEIERVRLRTRPATPAAPRPPRDGAAPLIGSTTAMAALRAKIERVAHTDFTVLLEGETRRELVSALWAGTCRKPAARPLAGAGLPQKVTGDLWAGPQPTRAPDAACVGSLPPAKDPIGQVWL
jgi:hypothetical protein